MDLERQRTTGRLDLRYEDVTQDGRVQLETMPVALGVIWRALMVDKPTRRAMRDAGIVPILTRFEIEGTPGPFGIERPLEIEGGYALGHVADAEGQVTRLLLAMDGELFGPKGRTNLPPPDDAGARALVGRVRAEHVFTRPFAPPEDRRVLALPFGGGGFVPSERLAWRPPTSTLDPPDGARPLEGKLKDDPVDAVIGLSHTDSNQHVNSLVYPRLFEDASLRRMAALGRPTQVLARKLDIAFRRPTFAGETLRLSLQAFERDGRTICVGVFFGPESRDPLRARVYAQMTFE
jgi:hypothetical protein